MSDAEDAEGSVGGSTPWSLDAHRIDWRPLPRSVRLRLAPSLYTLCQNPWAVASERLAAKPDLFRLRVGNWRLVYRLDRAHHTVIVEETGSREHISSRGPPVTAALQFYRGKSFWEPRLPELRRVLPR